MPANFLLSHLRFIARDEHWIPYAGFKFPGDHTARVTPVPIPNTEVKPRRADDTARATVWERRSSPGLKSNKAVLNDQSGLFVFGHEIPAAVVFENFAPRVNI